MKLTCDFEDEKKLNIYCSFDHTKYSLVHHGIKNMRMRAIWARIYTFKEILNFCFDVIFIHFFSKKPYYLVADYSKCKTLTDVADQLARDTESKSYYREQYHSTMSYKNSLLLNRAIKRAQEIANMAMRGEKIPNELINEDKIDF